MDAARISRRGFLAAGGVLIVGLGLEGGARAHAQTVPNADRFLGKPVAPDVVDSFLAVHADGSVTIAGDKDPQAPICLNNFGDVAFTEGTVGGQGPMQTILYSDIAGRVVVASGLNYRPYAMNDYQQICGAVNPTGFITDERAFRITPGSPSTILTLSSQSSRASDINNAGDVVGSYYPAAISNDKQHGFLYTDAGGFKDLGTLGGTFSTAYSLTQRDASGNPTGLLIARPNAGILYATVGKQPKLPPEHQMNSSRHFMRELNRLGVTSCILLCAAYRGGAVYAIPALVLTVLSFIYSLVDEVMHWRRYLNAQSDAVEMWSHVFILIGHGTMMAGWWLWYARGYAGVAETLRALGAEAGA
jgi:probable HAF family extracellular repeat protein